MTTIIHNEHTVRRYPILKGNKVVREGVVDSNLDLRCKYPWRSMQVGNSFTLPNTFRNRRNVEQAAYQRWERHLQKYSITQSDDRMTIQIKRVV